MKRNKTQKADSEEIKAILEDKPYYFYDKITDEVRYSLGSNIEEGAEICRKIMTDLMILV